MTGSYPELAAALAASARGRALILDGEVIAQTASGAPSFGLLQRRMHVARPSPKLIRSIPVQFYGFDVLDINGEPTTALPYSARRARLDELELPSQLVSVPPNWLGVESDRMLELALEHHLEGIVSKQVESAYRPGYRSPSWIKTPLRTTTEAIVAGWTTGTRTLSSTFGSLILAAHALDGHLVYIGNVGTGFTMAARRQLRAQLDALATDRNPFDASVPSHTHAGGVHWVRPELVGDIEYREYTDDDLRHPSWRGLRSDKDPSEIGLPT